MTATNRLKVCIMGCGRVGARVAELFAAQQHEIISVIDINEESFRRLSSKLRDRALVGDGTDPAILEKGGINDADVFIAVTNGDNRNILAAQIAKEQYHVAHVICRIYDPRRHQEYLKFGIESYCPTIVGADNIFHLATDAGK